MTRDEILRWLTETDVARLEELWTLADAARKQHVGDAVHLRGLIEISNHCARQCGYCGIRAPHTGVKRYRLSADEIWGCVERAVEYGYGTVVMQSGEDWGIRAHWLAALIRRIKTETELAVTLSLGERHADELALWRAAGADRYLLRFETSDAELYGRIHPGTDGQPGRLDDRLARLRVLKELGYEAGSGVMIGIPGQSYQSLAADIALFRELDLDMIGVGPYLAHPATPIGRGEWVQPLADGEQVPATELMGYKVLALTRLVCPEANLPSTTALATLNYESGRELGLMRGANVIMPNLTPPEYRCLYEIYPAKACLQESEEDFHQAIRRRIESVGRTVGTGPGGRLTVKG
ncbi:[FeFe] hydrogenase H-cluster radical SAM maturase HydE [bacterium]|nr:[FeFe] hydrogenase H-cluster radical SAM maturase HydE [bacterium]